jgi:hypothetical protein
MFLRFFMSTAFAAHQAAKKFDGVFDGMRQRWTRLKAKYRQV